MVRSLPPLELWAGIECTYNRVGNRRYDQLARTGHWSRVEDLDLIARSGVAAVRYPVLWEHVAGPDGSQANWWWPDQRLGRLRECGIRPIAGLLHHGDGPGDAGFEDPMFPERFASYARAVAERYPWLEDFTPINEPLTTARFAGLYGVWHPHAEDKRAFARILVAQLRATALAMRAIREVTPHARLIQNEDLGTAQVAQPQLQYQADFENERRWVTFDLLCGRLQPGMRMWDELLASGIDEHELIWFQEHPVPPDIIACDNYVTSDRLLDLRMDRYPAWSHGGNGTHRYANIESVRATTDEPPGILPILREAWARYGLTLIVGEAHLGSTREEQLRWLRDTWGSAMLARSEGVDVRSVTVWALFGLYDWNTLVTQDNGYYEPGPFDVRDGMPRPTAIASMMQALARRETFDHPALAADGWWRRPDRLSYPPVQVAPLRYREPRYVNRLPERPRAIALCPGEGQVADGIRRVASVRALPTLEASSAGDLARVWAIADTAMCDDAISLTEAAGRTRALALQCAQGDIPLVVMSCLHAAGHKLAPSGCAARNRARERAAFEAHQRTLVIRTGALFGPWDPADPMVGVLRGHRMPQTQRPLHVAYVPDAVNAMLDLLIDGEVGIWHVHHDAAVRWRDLAAAAMTMARGEKAEIRTAPVDADDEGRLYQLPKLADAVSRFVRESEPLWHDESEPPPARVIELDSGPGFEYPAEEPASTLARSPGNDVG